MDVEQTVILNKIKLLSEQRKQLETKNKEAKDELSSIDMEGKELENKIKKFAEVEANYRQKRIQHEILKRQNDNTLKRLIEKKNNNKSMKPMLLELMGLVKTELTKSNYSNMKVFENRLVDVFQNCQMTMVHKFLVDCICNEINYIKTLSLKDRKTVLNWDYFKFLASCLFTRNDRESYYIANINPEQLLAAPGSNYISNLRRHVGIHYGNNDYYNRNCDDVIRKFERYVTTNIRNFYTSWNWTEQSKGKKYKWSNDSLRWEEIVDK